MRRRGARSRAAEVCSLYACASPPRGRRSSQSGELALEYEQAAAKLKVGEVSDLVRTQFGYHIIKLTDRKKAGTAALDEVRSQLTDFLKNQKEDAEVSKLVKTLQGQAKIEILIPTGTTS